MHEATKTLVRQLSANGEYESGVDLVDAEFLYIQAQEGYLRAVQIAVETLKNRNQVTAHRRDDMTPQELDRLHSQVAEVKRLDSTLERMAKGAESDIEELGEKVISVIGRNVLDKRKDWVGDVVFCALFNALRHQREKLRHELSGSVEITECHHKIQEVLAHDK